MLLVDIGNSQIKSALVEGDNWSIWPTIATRSDDPFSQWPVQPGSTAPPSRVLLSNVAGRDVEQQLGCYVNRHWGVDVEVVKPQRSMAGFSTIYDDPARLGVDRWLAAMAAWKQTGGAVCVIDAGTALTVDIVNAAGCHQGGLIAPGLEMMRTSLTRGTAQLHSTGIAAVEGFATNTVDAISLGCTSAVRGLLADARAIYAAGPGGETPTWFLTGGAAPEIARLLPVPHQYEPQLVLSGLLIAGRHMT